MKKALQKALVIIFNRTFARKGEATIPQSQRKRDEVTSKRTAHYHSVFQPYHHKDKTYMRAVVQRVKHASVTINGEVKSAIKQGYLILLGIQPDDDYSDADWLCRKIAGLRIFDDENGIMNLDIKEVNGDVIVVSQFTLMASYKKGNRPSYIHAAGHDIAIPLYNYFCMGMTAALGKPVGTGEFGADMQVKLLNDGPVTICMDTKNKE